MSSANHRDLSKRLYAAAATIGHVLREIASGIDTWSAVRHGVIPLVDREHAPPSPGIRGE